MMNSILWVLKNYKSQVILFQGRWETMGDLEMIHIFYGWDDL